MKVGLNSARERILFLLVLWTIAILLIGISWSGWNQFRSERAIESAQRTAFVQTIQLKDEISEELQLALDGLDSESSPNVAEFVETIDALVRHLRLEPDLSRPLTRESDFYRFHNLQVVFRRVEMGDLIRFHNEMERRLPLVTIDSLAIVPSRNNPKELDATYRLRSIELIPEELNLW